jgi:hypothetical protein
MMGLINNKLERTWKEAVIAQFKVLTQHLPGETEENHKTLDSQTAKI